MTRTGSRSADPQRVNFIAYLGDLMGSGRALDEDTRSQLRALVEERDRFRQWEGLLNLFFRLDREGTFRFLGKENGERGFSYRFQDTASRSTVVIPAPPVSFRNADPHRARMPFLYPCPMPISAAALTESLRRSCRRELIERHLGDMVVLRVEGAEASVIGGPEGRTYDGTPRFLPHYVDEHVLGEGRCLLIADLRCDSVLRTDPVGRYFRSMGAFPLKPDAGRSPIGVLEVWRRAPGAFADETADFLAAFASFAANLAANVNHLEGLIFMDAVAGIFNRRSFDEILLDREIARADRSEQKIALLLVDIDDFKAINDTCGHPVGDRVLREVARLMRDRLRPLVDSVARLGGDEFAVLLPGMSEVDAARRVAERLLESVAEFDFTHLGRAMPGRVSLSIGGAVYDGRGNAGGRSRKDPKSQLIESADQALYEAKEAGKNRVVVWEEEIS